MPLIFWGHIQRLLLLLISISFWFLTTTSIDFSFYWIRFGILVYLPNTLHTLGMAFFWVYLAPYLHMRYDLLVCSPNYFNPSVFILNSKCINWLINVDKGKSGERNLDGDPKNRERIKDVIRVLGRNLVTPEKAETKNTTLMYARRYKERIFRKNEDTRKKKTRKTSKSNASKEIQQELKWI